MIKKILLFLCLVTLFSSCVEDDNDRIVGYWAFRQSNIAEIGADSYVVPYIKERVESYWRFDWEFFSDGIAIEYDDEYGPLKYTYYVENGVLWISHLKTGALYLSVPISVSGSTLSMFFDETDEMRFQYPRSNIDIVISESVFIR